MYAKADNKSDSEIVLQVIEGDVNAFEILLKRHKEHILKIVLRHLPFEAVEETIQDVFVRAFRSLNTFKGKGGFKQWLSSVAVRTCYDYWRKFYRSRERPMSSLGEKHSKWLEEVVDNQSSEFYKREGARKEARELLDWALDRLSPEDRMVMELVYLQGFSIKEASELMGWTQTNVKVRSFRTRKKLKKILFDLLEGRETAK
ncbi:RNA polymerase sigma factor [Thermodesulfobacteriota bacterium]